MNYSEYSPRCGWIEYRRRQAILSKLKEAASVLSGLVAIAMGVAVC